MASPSTVISRGLGSWGSVNLLPTFGYGSGEAVVVGEGLGFSLPNAYEPEFSLPELHDISTSE